MHAQRGHRRQKPARSISRISRLIWAQSRPALSIIPTHFALLSSSFAWPSRYAACMMVSSELLRSWARARNLAFTSARLSGELSAFGGVLIGLSFPHECVKPSSRLEPQLAIKFHGLVIGFRHGKAQSEKVPRTQLLGAETNQRLANPSSAMLRKNAHLGYMANIVSHAGTQQQAGDGARGTVQGNKRRIAIEDATAGEADNVVQETQ